jgi:hypothetical protein
MPTGHFFNARSCLLPGSCQVFVDFSTIDIDQLKNCLNKLESISALPNFGSTKSNFEKAFS